MNIERNINIASNNKPKLLSEIFNKINIKLNNKIETRLNIHSSMQKMVSHKTLTVNEINKCDLMFFSHTQTCSLVFMVDEIL